VAARGRTHLHSGAPAGDGWKRAPDLADDPGYGQPLPVCNPKCPPPLDPRLLCPSADALRKDRVADYGRSTPGGTPYSYDEYAERYHRLSTDGTPDINWPPNEGAVRGKKLDYYDASKFIGDHLGDNFGDRMDRLGPPDGRFMGLMEDGTAASYEDRALHYGSLYAELHAYTLIPDKLPNGYKIRVMDTAPALGQPGGSLGLLFLDDKGNQVRVQDLADPRIGALRHDG
jgi:hypothetical protein